MALDVKHNPDEFAARALTLFDPDLARWWSVGSFNDAFSGTSEALANSAFNALAHWSTISFAGMDSLQMRGIQRATMTATRCILDSEARSYQLTRQLGLYFHSQNIGVAFCAMRQFNVHDLWSHAMFVIDHLVKVASAAEVPVSPNPMSLRAIAFKVLFDLDPNFTLGPNLQ